MANFKINSRPLFTIIFKLKNDNFKTQDFSPLIERVLAGVGQVEAVTIDGHPRSSFIVVSLVCPNHIFIDSAAPGMVVHGGSRNASDMSRFKLMSQ